jgi:Na+/melibiose symporter-like transporter
LIFASNSGVMVAYGFMLTPGFGVIAAEFGLEYNTVNGQFGWSYFIVGLICFVTTGLAVKFGKRPIFLAGNLLVLATSIWAMYAKSWHMLLASQLVASLGFAPYETLVSATIADL